MNQIDAFEWVKHLKIVPVHGHIKLQGFLSILISRRFVFKVVQKLYSRQQLFKIPVQINKAIITYIAYFSSPCAAKAEAGGRWLLIICYANVPRQSVFIWGKISLSSVFHIIVTVKITFLLTIESAHHFYINNQFWFGYSKLMWPGGDGKQLIY